MVKTTPFDAAEFLDSPEAIAEYLNEAFSDGDVAFVARAIGTAARHGRRGAGGRPEKIYIDHWVEKLGPNSTLS